MTKNKKVLILYQSSIELSIIINLIKNYSLNTCVIIVTGGNQLLLALKKLNLKKKYKVEIYDFSSTSLKNPINLFFMFYEYHISKVSKKIMNYNFNDAFFFSQHEDFVAPIFLSKCNIKKITQIVVYWNKSCIKIKKKFPYKNQKKISFFLSFKFMILKFLLNNKNIIITLQKNKFQELTYYKIRKKINIRFPSINKNSYFKLSSKKKNKKTLLYIDSNEEPMEPQKFKVITNEIFKVLEIKGYNIIIKKHLRVKLSKSLIGNYKREYMLDPIPLELYDLKKIKLVMGLSSAAVGKVAENNADINCFSTEKMIFNKKKAEKTITELNLISPKNKLYYPTNLSDIISLT
jgi:hypothetical protein